MPDRQRGKPPTAEELAEEDDLHTQAGPESVEFPSRPAVSNEEDVPLHTEAHGGPDAQAADAPSGTDQPDDFIDVDDIEVPAEFDPRFREEFEGLLYIGKLTKTFNYLGHVIVIRTLTVDELIEVGLLNKPYQGTLGDMKAYQAAMCAGCIVTVDGKPLPQPITMNADDTPLRNRFEFVVKNYYPVTLDAIYQQFLLLEETVNQIIVAMSDSAPLASAASGTPT